MGEHPPPLNLCCSLPSDAKAVRTDLFDAVKQAAADGATVSEMQTTVAEQLAPQYEAGMSKYPLGRYRDRIEATIEIVYHKVVHAH